MSRIIKKDEADKRVKSYGNYFIRHNIFGAESIEDKALRELKELRIKAEAEAEKIVNEARRKAILEEENGFAEGIKRGLEGIKPLESALKSLLNELKDFCNNYPANIEREIARLSAVIAGRIIKEKVDADDEVVVRNVRAAFEEITDKEFIKIRVNKYDFELMNKFKKEIIESFHEIKGVEIIVDDAVDGGGCIIETKEGSLDATLKGQYKMLVDNIVCNREIV